MAFAPSFWDENLKLIGAKHDSFKKKTEYCIDGDTQIE